MGGTGLVACLTFCALGGSFVAALGTPMIPTMSGAFGVSLDDAQWTLTIALLIGAVGTPLISRWGDGGRRKRVLAATLILTVIGAALGAVAPNYGVLLLGRAFQGAGYGIAPVAIGIVRELMSGARMRRAVATLSVTLAIGVGIGNPITGAFVTYVNFRAAFWFAAAFGLVSLLWLLAAVPDRISAGGRVRIDIPGALLLSAGLGAAMIALSRGDSWGWASAPVLGLGGGGIAALIGWAALELRLANPLVDLRLAALPSVIGANAATVFLGVAMFGGTPMLVRLMQTPTSMSYGLGATTFVAAMVLFLFSLGSLGSQFALARLQAALGLRRLLPLAGVLVGVAWTVNAWVHVAVWQIALVHMIAGVGMGIAFAVLPLLITAAVPAERTASANGLNTVIRLIGGTVGSTGISAILTADTPAGAQYSAEAGYIIGGMVSAGACFASAAIGWLFIRNADHADARRAA
ncbi:MAG: MFS transporter [Frankiaceae bacterium]|nr:MFS transporter [Frankiaceae bacterium]